MSQAPAVIPHIERRIYTVRGMHIMLDADLAELYGVETKVFLQAVKRNQDRFPDDFMFQFSAEEFSDLRSHIVTSKRGGRRYRPYAFTEQGVAMLSSVLRSERAVRVNIEIMRTFVQMRRFLGTHDELARNIGELQKKIKTHDREIALIFSTINSMLHPVTKKKRPIGFQSGT